VITLALANGPLLPAWVVLPMALLTLIVVSAHIQLLLGDREMPPSRRRIRLCSGALMLVSTPLIAFAFGILRPIDARIFTLVWTAIIGILLLVVMLAGLDTLNTLRLHASSRRTNRGNIARLRGELAAVVAAANNAQLEHRHKQPEQTEPEGPGARDPGHRGGCSL